ncbi:hypothetical protein QFC19_003393 [Naganishia cerealis]|uniref:Uncharacterized protein n=1 Tax=Naganishia cerealis TaxID=610337 RepID=A0ACC2W3Y5_9TREE|nr:hypothetical protein QFC19_003393 [Naganishia cerealis]
MPAAYIQRASQVQPTAAREGEELLTLDDEALMDDIEADLDSVSPAATKAAYGPAQREFREWCLSKAEKEGKEALDQILDPVERATQDVKRLVSINSRQGLKLHDP